MFVRATKSPNGRRTYLWVKCPKCGKEGTVRVANRFGKFTKYSIYHNGKWCCNVGITHPAWDEIDMLYKKYVRR